MQDTKAKVLGYTVPARFYSNTAELDTASGKANESLRLANEALWSEASAQAGRALIAAIAAATNTPRNKGELSFVYLKRVGGTTDEAKAAFKTTVQALADKLAVTAVSAAAPVKSTVTAQGMTPKRWLEKAALAIKTDKGAKALNVLKGAGIVVTLNGDDAANIKTLGRAIFAREQKLAAEEAAKRDAQYA